MPSRREPPVLTAAPASPTAATAASGASGPPLHRSGAVARMLRMPVATLRVWERRYALTQPALSPSGQRLYSADDVRRLALLKQLTDLGHAIGSLAPLDMVQLQRVAATHAQALATTQSALPAATAQSSPGGDEGPWRLAVVGQALGRRLQRLRPPSVELLGPYDSLEQAAEALQRQDLDALLLHAPQLQAGWREACGSAAPAFAGLPLAVLFGFAAAPVCEALVSAGTALLREPQPDAVLVQWLRGLAQAAQARPVNARRPGYGAHAAEAAQAMPADVPSPRWNDAALADFAGLSSTIACECPRHVAELLVQLSHFEAYSAQCESRSPADAELHTYLRRVAANARASFEAALEHVALHEGLTLPAPTSDSHSNGPTSRFHTGA